MRRLISAILPISAMAAAEREIVIVVPTPAHDCLLVTRNSREFERVVGLRVEVWG
jgi:hypothetical protein